MNWLEAVNVGIRAAAWERAPEPPESEIREGAGVHRSAALGGARASMTSALALAGSTYGVAVVEPVSAEEKWSLAGLDDRTMEKMRPAQLLELLVDISPDISKRGDALSAVRLMPYGRQLVELDALIPTNAPRLCSAGSARSGRHSGVGRPHLRFPRR